eukprot:6576215-Karenia_brevis.AAC.1
MCLHPSCDRSDKHWQAFLAQAPKRHQTFASWRLFIAHFWSRMASPSTVADEVLAYPEQGNDIRSDSTNLIATCLPEKGKIEDNDIWNSYSETDNEHKSGDKDVGGESLRKARHFFNERRYEEAESWARRANIQSRFQRSADLLVLANISAHMLKVDETEGMCQRILCKTSCRKFSREKACDILNEVNAARREGLLYGMQVYLLSFQEQGILKGRDWGNRDYYCVECKGLMLHVERSCFDLLPQRVIQIFSHETYHQRFLNFVGYTIAGENLGGDCMPKSSSHLVVDMRIREFYASILKCKPVHIKLDFATPTTSNLSVTYDNGILATPEVLRSRLRPHLADGKDYKNFRCHGRLGLAFCCLAAKSDTDFQKPLKANDWRPPNLKFYPKSILQAGQRLHDFVIERAVRANRLDVSQSLRANVLCEAAFQFYASEMGGSLSLIHISEPTRH